MIPPDNPQTPAKIALGKALFFDDRLSADGKVSCDHCHAPAKGFTDQLPTSMGIHAQFVDVILLQTLITFLLYFAPTPGGSGLAEVLSVAVMSIYVPRALTPSYILLWRVVTCYLTVGIGSLVFWQWLKGAEERAEPSEATGVSAHN